MDDFQDAQLRNPALDDVLRPALLVEPPAAVQHAILAAVLRATAPAPLTIAVPVAARAISPMAYLLLGAVLVTYVGVVSWLEGLVGGTVWLMALTRQLAVAADLAAGQALTAEPLRTAWALVQAAPWLLLLPVGWVLWERDRAAVGAN